MNWSKAGRYGPEFLKQLKEFLDGDYSKINKQLLVDGHIAMMKNGGWTGFDSFNQLSVKQLIDVLGLVETEEERNDFSEILEGFKIVEVIKPNKPVPLIFCKEDETKHLEFDDYTELIKYAESIGDKAWRDELLEREVAQ